MSRYLVTGCAGFIGSHLTEALLARGDRVLGIDAFSDYYPRQCKESNLAGVRQDAAFELIEADVADLALDAMDGFDGVFHLAAQPGVRGSWGDTFAVYVTDNIVSTQKVFETAIAAGVRVVWASSSSIYGNAETYPTREDTWPQPVSPYGVTKVACEYLASAYGASRGLDAVALRYFTVYGPRQRPDMAFARIVGALVEGTPFTLFGDGSQSRQFTFVSDVVRATIAAMELGRAGAIYNVGGGSESSLRHAIELAEHISGHRLDVRHEAFATGDVVRTAADTSRALADLSWRPEVGLEEGLVSQVAWARGNPLELAPGTGS